jgi:tripartite-type tricarboxylate transporter receptor subunit TctC
VKRALALVIITSLLFAVAGCGAPETEKANGENDQNSANKFPNRQIRYIVPYGPGGLSDMTARAIEKTIRTDNLLDVPFTVTNIDGASAGNGMTEVRDAKPDGHTILHHHTSFIAHQLTGVRDWGFEAFTPVAAPGCRCRHVS